MKTFFYNIGYYLLEAGRTIKLTPVSNFFSVIGTGLILFLLGLVLTGWAIGDRLVVALQNEAEISAYFTDNIDESRINELVGEIKDIDGVTRVKYIDSGQAYEQNKEMLGNEAEILDLFDENPFEAYLDIRISLKSMDSVLAKTANLSGIDYVRDNREVLSRLKGIVDALKLLGSLIACAVGITTLIIISHMIRQGIFNNRDQINTFRLLGAPGWFIGLPFILAGTILTLLGGAAAAALLYLLMREGYSQLSGTVMFLPVPPMEELRDQICSIILAVSAGLGLIGSFFGLTSIRK